jgi:hypothetical protein
MKSPVIRLTQSGACASCGAYGYSQHASTCRPELRRRFKLERSAACRHDSAIEAAIRDRARLDNDWLWSKYVLHIDY